MNQRIRELAEQSNLTIATSSLWEHKVQEFAELIVRECVAICQDVDGEDNIDARSSRQDCAVEIREHFGVEQ